MAPSGLDDPGIVLEDSSLCLIRSMLRTNVFHVVRLRQGFGRRGNGNNQTNGSNSSSPTSSIPPVQALGNSPSYSSNMGSDAGTQAHDAPEPIKFFFREKYARLGVKGNFMPLAAQPKNVELGEWLAHQVAEQYRVLVQVISCIQEMDEKVGMPICNPRTCPTMSAGRHTYTWLNSHKEPIKVPAVQYIELVQRWINGKLNDPRAFPTDNITSTAHTYASGGLNTPSANTPIAMGPTTSTAPLSTLAGHDWVGKSVGFQENFYHDCKNIMRQIFRIYAHVYHAHWIDPFWHISTNSLGWPDLNSCFVHFICVAKLFGLLTEKDMEPMAPLIEIWIANGSIPPDAASGACTIVQTQ
ncbi:hypothetical protein MMC06_003159 [Schaereria dolodes]|nr:hypothetical protein [Schaereria dolodes]